MINVIDTLLKEYSERLERLETAREAFEELTDDEKVQFLAEFLMQQEQARKPPRVKRAAKANRAVRRVAKKSKPVISKRDRIRTALRGADEPLSIKEISTITGIAKPQLTPSVHSLGEELKTSQRADGTYAYALKSKG